MNHRMQYMQSSEQCHTEGNTFKASFLACLVLSFASGALFAWGTGSRRRGPTISESNGSGGPIISGDPSLHDSPATVISQWVSTHHECRQPRQPPPWVIPFVRPAIVNGENIHATITAVTGLEIIKSPIYYPASNGFAERAVQIVKKRIKNMKQKHCRTNCHDSFLGLFTLDTRTKFDVPWLHSHLNLVWGDANWMCIELIHLEMD